MEVVAVSYTIGLAQSTYPKDEDVIAQARDFAGRAASEGCDLLVFPENFMWPRKLSSEEVADLAEPVDGLFVQRMYKVAREFGMWVVFTINECNPDGGLPYNTAVAVDNAGALRGSYRKCHLYDALGVRESDRLSAGAQPAQPVHTPFCTMGMQVCYDLRFPEPARIAALAGCNLMVYPSAWHVGRCKPDQWETLLRARAVENELFVAGVCRSGRGFVGQSMVVDPMGRVLARGGRAAKEGLDQLVTCTIDPAVLQSTRKSMPILEHRRPELYSEILS